MGLKYSNIFLCVLFLFIVACESLQLPKTVVENTETIHFKKSLKMSVNGQVIEGVGVVDLAKSYKFILKTKGGDIDKILVMTCHRELMFDGPESGWFKSPRIFEFEFVPVAEIESKDGCKMDISALSKTRGRFSLATLDFMDLDTDVVGSNFCGGTVSEKKGVGICQEREGLKQKIQFKEQMKTMCDFMESEDSMNFEYFLPLGERTCYFMNKRRGLYRLTTIGYENVFLD